MCTRIGCGVGRQNVTIRRGIRRRWDVVQLFSQRPPGGRSAQRPYQEVLVGSIRSFYVCKLHYRRNWRHLSIYVQLAAASITPNITAPIAIFTDPPAAKNRIGE